jgi:hypothetical protein
MAAFVADDQGNWYFDLGVKKGWAIVSDEENVLLTESMMRRVQPMCPKCVEKSVAVDPATGQRLFPDVENLN